MKKAICLLLAATLFSCHKLFDYLPNPHEALPEFNKVFGGSNSDQFFSIAAQKDAAFVLAGETLSTDDDMTGNADDYHGLVIKVDKSGNKVWQKILGGEIKSVTATQDGGYIIAGVGGERVSNENHGASDAWLVKLDGTGAVMWQKEFGGSRSDKANAVIESEGGYIVAGSLGRVDSLTYYDVFDAWIFKLDNNGNLVWQNVIGGGKGIEADEAVSITKSPYGGYVLTGPSYRGATDSTDGNMDVLVAKFDVGGKLVWRKTLGTPEKQEEMASITNGADGGYAIAGFIASTFGRRDDALVFKIDEDGNVKWQKTYGGSNSDYINTISATADNGYIMAGSTASTDGDVSGNHGHLDAWVVALASDGHIRWQKTLGGSGFETANGIVARSDGSYVMAGAATSADGDVPLNHGNQDAWVITVKGK